ncbi:MAG: hypothetical protein ISR76_04255 [Planctomycetes bacterium]|nr:hypothetical protein [Planctomycetota bacterium]MBL7008186.1 hypothetical protein [Planctomycetota bacterium]
MISALLLVLPAPVFLPQPQEPAATAEKTEKKAEKRAFPKLQGPDKRKAEGWLLDLRSSKKDETADAARDGLSALGAAVVPAAIQYWTKMGEERLPYLVAVLDAALADLDLDLAWKEVDKKTAPEARVYLVRRVADSQRKDALELLAARLKDAEEGSREAYEAARGLAWRKDDRGLAGLLAATGEDWGEHRDRLRKDFAKIERGPLSVQTAGLVRQAKSREDRLAALHLFELVGGKTQLGAMKPVLRDPDNIIKLAAINACRAVHGEEPVDNASVMQIIDLGRSWEARI